jgi:predicted nuclease of predicted toxin-antitoxin system
VKFLFDENLSPTLVGILAREFPNCTHVRDIGLRGAEDGQIWDHARAQDFMIVSNRAYCDLSGLTKRFDLPEPYDDLVPTGRHWGRQRWCKRPLAP